MPSHYGEAIRIYESLPPVGASIYRDIRQVCSHHSSIVDHIETVKFASRCLAEKRPFPARDWVEKTYFRYEWFKTNKGEYVDVGRHWKELVEASITLLTLYEKELDNVERTSQLNCYRIGPIITVVVTIAKGFEAHPAP